MRRGGLDEPAGLCLFNLLAVSSTPTGAVRSQEMTGAVAGSIGVEADDLTFALGSLTRAWSMPDLLWPIDRIPMDFTTVPGRAICLDPMVLRRALAARASL